MDHFKNNYRAKDRATIIEVVKMTSFFPIFVNEVDNEILLEDVSKEELQTILHTFQKDKSPRIDGWLLNFYMGFFDTIE